MQLTAVKAPPEGGAIMHVRDGLVTRTPLCAGDHVMSEQARHIVCPHCDGINRIPPVMAVLVTAIHVFGLTPGVVISLDVRWTSRKAGTVLKDSTSIPIG